MGVEDWSTDEALNLELDGADISRHASPGAPANELTRKLMAHVKELEEKIVSDGVAVDGITIENNGGTLTVKDVAIDGDTTDLLTEKIAEIEAAATQAGEDATAAQTAATQAASSAASAATAITSASTAANLAAEQADIAARAAARAQSGAAMAESAVQAVVAQTNLNWQKTEKAASVTCYPVPETVLEPVVDFLFSETPPASGDKGPENPSTLTGVSSVTVTHCETTGVDSTDYTIDLGGTYCGGSVDMATGVMTVTHYGIVLDSTTGSMFGYGTSKNAQNQIYARRVALKLNGTVHGLPQCITSGYNLPGAASMTHFQKSNAWTGAVSFWLQEQPDQWFIISDDTGLFFSDSRTAAENRQYFLDWLDTQKTAGTPVTLCYKLQTPQTVQLSPLQITALALTDKYTPRLNTVYTDASSVQVGYAKSPIRSEYELTQAILATEGGE